MKNIDFATATRLDLEIWDTQNKIKYITYQLFPSKRANTLQTIKNIKYFTKKTDVELIFPDRRQGSKEKQIDLELINDFYD